MQSITAPMKIRNPGGPCLLTRLPGIGAPLAPLPRRRTVASAHSRMPPPPPEQEQSGGHRPALPKLPEPGTDLSSNESKLSTPVLAAAALALLLPLADPAAAEAASRQISITGMYWACWALGFACVGTTLLLVSRFLLSFFPSLEKKARQRPSAMVYRALTATDPVLDPITKGFFQMTEQGDLNYGAMALLAVLSAIMTILLGHEGLMVDQVPDLALLGMLQYLVFFQHMTLLPMWTLVVFRWFLLV